jgi:hypothetical protein
VEPIRFDLSDVSAKQYRLANQFGRTVASTVALLFGALIAWKLVTGYEFTLDNSIILGIAAFVFGYTLFYAVWVTRYPPVGLTIDSKGVEFHFRSGSVSRQDWNRPGFRLQIHDFRREAPDYVYRRVAEAAVGGYWRMWPIPGEAVTAILAEADTQGIRVEEGVSRSLSGIGGSRLLTVHGRSGRLIG